MATALLAQTSARWMRAPFIVTIIAWLLVMAFLPRQGEARIVYLWAHYGLFPIVFAASVLRRAAAREKLHFEWPDLAMAAYLLITVVSVLRNGEFEGSRLEQLATIHRTVFIPFVGYWLISSNPRAVKEVGLLAPVMLASSVMECAIGLVAWFRLEMLPGIWIGQVRQFGGPRVVGSFTQPDVYSGALLFFSVFVFQYAITTRRRWLKSLCLIVFDISMFCVMLSYSRASWLAASVLLAGIACLHLRDFLAFILPGLLIGIALLFGALAPDYAADRLATVETIANRAVSAGAGVRLFLERPVFGWGYGTYDLHDHEFVEDVGGFEASDWDKDTATSHNTYLTVLAESGMVGLLLYLFPFGWWLAVAVRGARRRGDLGPSNGFVTWRFFLLVGLTLLSFGIIGNLIDLRYCPFAVTVQWLLLGILASYTNHYLHPKE